MSITIKFDLRIFNQLLKNIQTIKTEPLDSGTRRVLGFRVVETMLDEIASGRSPVQKLGQKRTTRYPAYKNAKRYPGKRKSHKPVNLRLSGEFLANLGNRNTKQGAEIFYNSQLSQKKEEGHRHRQNGQPSRPTIPEVANGETFSDKIMDKAEAIVLKGVTSKLKFNF